MEEIVECGVPSRAPLWSSTECNGRGVRNSFACL